MTDVRAEALEVVLDALEWRLTKARWQAVEQAILAMRAALAADDLEALAGATTDLELAGPLRIIRIGTTPAVAAAPPIRDLLNQMVHSLGGTPTGEDHDGT